MVVDEVDSATYVSESPHPNEISWCVHPFVENWKRTIFLLLFLSSILVILYIGFQSIVIVFFSALLLIGPLYKYFLPFHYHCTHDSMVVKACCYNIERPWTSFRSNYIDKNGILLSPFSKPTRLENFRGIYIRFGKHPPEEIVNFIQHQLNMESNDERI